MRATDSKSIRAPRDVDRPTLLMVGSGDPMDAALKVALDRHGLFVEAVDLDNLRPSVQLTAPDLILLLGDAAEQGGVAALTALSTDPSSGAVPVVLLAPDAGLESRMHAFRHGAMAVVPRSASPDAVARKVASLTREMSEHFEEKTGEIGEATFDELVELVKKELRSGILSVHAPKHKGGPMRVVLGAGRPVAEAVQEFVARLKPHVATADSMYYQFHTSAGGPVELLEMDGSAGNVEVLKQLRVLLVDDDPARADTLAQELRARGAIVFVTDTAGRGLERAVGLDPQVAIVDAAGLEGPGFEVVRALRKDLRLRWASILIAPWDEILPRGASMPDIEKLASRIEPLLVPERDLVERSRGKDPFDVRLESMGPGRMLRILVESGATFHVTIRNPKAVVDVDLAQGLLVGASAKTTSGETVEGTLAIAALLSLGSGRVHVEHRANPSVANVMTPVDEVLAVASKERSIVPASHPPEPMPERVSTPRVPIPKPAVVPKEATKAPRPSTKPLAPAKAAIPKKAPASPAKPATNADMRWGSGKTGEFVSLADDDDEGTQGQTQIKNLAELAKAGEAFLVDDSTETVRPPSLPVDPAETRPTPKPPAVGGPVAANERNRPARPRRATLTMGAPMDLPVSAPSRPSVELGANSAPSAAESIEREAPAPSTAAESIELEVEPSAASESIELELESMEREAPSTVIVEPEPPAHVALPPPPALPSLEPRSRARMVSTDPPPAAAPAEPRKKGGARTLAVGSVVLASLVLAAVLGLIGYRYSGWHDERLDHVLVLLGTDPAPRGESADEPSADESAASEVENAADDNAAGENENATDDNAANNAANDSAANNAAADNAADDAANDDAANDDAANDDAASDNAANDNAASDNAANDNAANDNAANDAANDNAANDASNDNAAAPSADEDTAGTDVQDLLRRAERAGSSELAERLYRRVLELDPQEHHAMVDLARLLMDRGANTEAADLLRRAVARRPRRAPYRVMLGDALSASGDAAAARQEWERALELEPNNAQARRRLGQ